MSVWFDAEQENQVIYTLMNRKHKSPTQPGRGIRKIVDLYHDLQVLVEKAGLHASRKVLDPEELKERDRLESVGFSEDEVKERRKE